MAANLKARIAALKSTVAGGASGQATLARTNAWRAWAASQSKDIVTFCEYALEELTDANDPQHSGHSCRDLIIPAETDYLSQGAIAPLAGCGSC